MGIRLPEKTLTDLDQIADEVCNTRSGLIRLAVDQLVKAHNERKARQHAEPELPLGTGDEDEEESQIAAEEPA